MSTAQNLTQQAKDEFLERNKNLLALTRNGVADVFKRITASLALDENAQADVMFHLDVLDQKGYAGQIARNDFKQSMYVAICKAFLKVQRNFRIEFVTRLTPEALAELEGIEVSAGERAPALPPPPQKSAQELLTEEIRHDWLHLGMDRIKKKFNNPAYKKRFDELINELPSQCTTLHDGLQGFSR